MNADQHGYKKDDESWRFSLFHSSVFIVVKISVHRGRWIG